MAAGKWQLWEEDPAQLERLTNWAANGLTNAEIAQSMGIHRNTLAKWMAAHECISGAIKRGRLLACEAIENALFKRAKGDVVVTETVEEERDVLTGGGAVVTLSTSRTTTRTVPPDTAAAIFYLKNRMPDRYTDRRETRLDVSAPTIALGVATGRAE